jgi:hypothetical protein
VGQGKLNSSVAQSDSRNLLDYVCYFSIGAFQKFAPGWQLVKNVADLNGRANVGAAGRQLGFVAAVNLNAIACELVWRAPRP